MRVADVFTPFATGERHEHEHDKHEKHEHRHHRGHWRRNWWTRRNEWCWDD